MALALLLTGFALGWTLNGQSGRSPAVSGDVSGRTADAPPETSPPADPGMPLEDAPGEDISRLPRYPGSIRLQYAREDLDNVVWTEVEYVTPARVETVREFYRDVFRDEGWSVGDVGFSKGKWTFFVAQDEREVYVELETRDDIVEVDFELTEPKGGAMQEQQPEPG